MACISCGDDPCSCRRGLAVVSSQQAMPQRYQFRQCTTPGCSVMIGFLTGSVHGLTACKWCQAGVSHKA